MSAKICPVLLLFLLALTAPAQALDWDTQANKFVWTDTLTRDTTAPSPSAGTSSPSGVTANTEPPPIQMRSIHFAELRDAIDYAASADVCNVPAVWGDTTETVRAAIGAQGVSVSSVHINAMRTAVGALYAAKSQPVPAVLGYTVSAGTRIQASDVQELRDALDYVVQNFCSPAISPPPSCAGGQFWDGTQCSCMPGQVWNGTSCAAAPSCPSGTFIFEMPFGQYTANWDTDCSDAINKPGFNPLNTFWYKQDCPAGGGTPPGDYCIVPGSRRVQDARSIGCGGPMCIYCSLVTRSLMCSGTVVSGGGQMTTNRRFRQITA